MSAELICLDKVFDDATALVSRVDALALSLKRYFTGKPCKRGHVAERKAINSECLECAKQYASKQYASNPNKMRELSSRYRAKNPETARESVAKWRANNADYQKKQRAANLDVYRNHCVKRRARKRHVIVSPDADLIVRRLSSEDTFCFYCDALLLAREVHVDHVIPLAQFGPHAAINFVAACATCNTRKSSKRPSEWSRLPKRNAARAIARENEIAEWIANYVLGDN